MKSNSTLKVRVNYGNGNITTPRYIDTDGNNKCIYETSSDNCRTIDVDQLIASLKSLYDSDPDNENNRAVVAESLILELCRQYCMALNKAGMGRTFLTKIQEVITPLVKKLVDEQDLNVAMTTRDLLIHSVVSISLINGYRSLDLTEFSSVVHKFMNAFKIMG